MKIEALAKLFPIKTGASENPADLNFESQGHPFHIAKNELTQREISLFNDVLFQAKTLDFDRLPHGTYRVIQFKSQGFSEIAENLSLIFPGIVKVKQITPTYGIAIEKMPAERLSEGEIKQVLGTLTQDLGGKCDYYLGLFADQTELSTLYPTEQNNFDHGLSFSESLIKAGLGQVTSPPLNKIKQGLLTDVEAQDLITQLYQHDGNQLKTAKAMYIHRNTLTQKIKKFERQYGLTLSGSDLVLLYSLI